MQIIEVIKEEIAIEVNPFNGAIELRFNGFKKMFYGYDLPESIARFETHINNELALMFFEDGAKFEYKFV